MQPPKEIVAKDGICELEWVLPEGHTLEEWAGAAPDLLVEIPHGATRTRDYERLRARLSPSLPEDLVDFFHVNTDVGAPEYGLEVARQVVAGGGVRPLLALVVRCLLPRTFIDTNRVAEDSSAATARTELNAAISEYVRDAKDVDLLVSLHQSYHDVADRAFDWVCGGGGIALAPHTYAPRSIQIDDFDEGIGKAIRAAYEPDVYDKWKVRPPVDLITLAPDGRDLSPRSVVDAIQKRYEAMDVGTAENDTYRLHPSTMAYRYADRYPGQVLCVELRRDYLADPFTPFAEMHVPKEKAERMAAPIAASLLEALLGRK
ncbi:MAG: hypothetical protein KDA27_27460 [Candidatus Eisenbacteria bacterium]|uniref:N-formylglutamate amidohydrolase n=1 Tax=Eiseniibacteriota bacterium TaxID=2212470 RepID=A0A956NIF4_UNCEI|nr:hypothetical protein [Candidatus Eisenbacteria bacterium]